jgi:hypothetical protein
MNTFPSSPSKILMPLQPAPQPHYPPRSVPTQHTPTPSHVQSSPPPPQPGSPLKRKVGSLGLDSPKMQGMGVGSMGPPQQNGYTLPQTPTPYRDGVQHVNGALGAENVPTSAGSACNTPTPLSAGDTSSAVLEQTHICTTDVTAKTSREARWCRLCTTRARTSTTRNRLPALPATLVQNKSFTQITVVLLLTSLSQILPP